MRSDETIHVPQLHRSAADGPVRCAVVTVSDTRTLETDRGGALAAESLTGGGHLVVRREIVADEPVELRRVLIEALGHAEAVLVTGGTGIAPRDQTYETVCGLIDKPIPGYGELLRMLSFQEIGAAAMLSRATAGVAGGKLLITMPGSPAGVRLAIEKLILPELGHLVREATKQAALSPKETP